MTPLQATAQCPLGQMSSVRGQPFCIWHSLLLIGGLATGLIAYVHYT